ncbi:MAG: hypothetical protein KJ601_00415 [Nanoarchaeota archaeon]|nr:hypothetical protein [Nanoarchaeota archaeon]MBU1704366.1 hypothetical protein [Nanoarchaeota archaeon]
MVVPIIMAVVMGIGHYYSQEFCTQCRKNGIKITSFAAGVAVSYLFLELFPNFSSAAMQENRFLFLMILSGFVIFHIIEKYIYKRAPKDKLLRDLALEDSVISFAYHVLVGIVLVNFFEVSLLKAVLFFVPIFFYTAVSTLPVDPSKYKWVKIVLSSSTLIGVLFGMFIPIPILLTNVIIGFVIGTMIYTVIRHSIPFEKEGEPLIFAVGVILYSAFIVWTWLV